MLNIIQSGESGLSHEEIDQIKAIYGFCFPPDYRTFVMFALPISHGSVDWHKADQAQIQWPYEGICYDIEHNHFGLRAWGPRPVNLNHAFTIAQQAVEKAPRLIPVRGHRYPASTTISRMLTKR